MKWGSHPETTHLKLDLLNRDARIADLEACSPPPTSTTPPKPGQTPKEWGTKATVCTDMPTSFLVTRSARNPARHHDPQPPPFSRTAKARVAKLSSDDDVGRLKQEVLKRDDEISRLEVFVGQVVPNFLPLPIRDPPNQITNKYPKNICSCGTFWGLFSVVLNIGSGEKKSCPHSKGFVQFLEQNHQLVLTTLM